jgi:hypothetical protein
MQSAPAARQVPRASFILAADWPRGKAIGASPMGDTSTTDATLDRTDEDILASTVSDEALEAAAGTTRMFTAMITDCPTLIAACCGGR